MMVATFVWIVHHKKMQVLTSHDFTGEILKYCSIKDLVSCLLLSKKELLTRTAQQLVKYHRDVTLPNAMSAIIAVYKKPNVRMLSTSGQELWNSVKPNLDIIREGGLSLFKDKEVDEKSEDSLVQRTVLGEYDTHFVDGRKVFYNMELGPSFATSVAFHLYH
jgi:hypothetical protein